MNRWLFTALLILWATVAQATNWYPDNQLSLTAAQAAAQPGDTLFLEGQQTYSNLAPARAGNTLQPIVIIGGDLSNPGSTAIQRVVPKSHCRFYGLAFSDTVNLNGSPSRVVFDHCNFSGSLDFRSADSSSVRSSSLSGAYLRVCRNLLAGDDNSAVADTLEWNTFTGLNATSEFAMAYGNTSPANYVSGFVRRFNRFAVTQSGSTAWSIDKHWRTSNMVSYANYLQITSTASGVGGNEGNFVSLWRDSSHTLSMKRDTIFVDNGTASMSETFYGLITSAGMGGAYSTSCTNYSIDSCYIRMVRGSPMYFQGQIPGAKIRYNVLRTRTSTGLEIANAFLASSNDPYFHHNTIWGKQAVFFGGYAATGGRFSNNILYGTSTSTCSDWEAVGGNQDAVALSDSNLVYSSTGDSTRAFSRGTCSSPRTGSWASAGNDSHSYWSNPAFTDTTWTSFNPLPGPLSLAAGSGNFTLGYPGAAYQSVEIVQEDPPAQHGYPRVGLYGGAGATPRNEWWPFVATGRDSLQTTQIADAARFDVITLNPAFADSAGPYGSYVALTAIKALREANPSILVLGEPLQTAAYIRSGADTANTYNYYFQAWRAARDGGGGWSATGAGAPAGAWTPHTTADSASGGKGFLWTARPGYKQWFYQTAGSGMSAGTQGNAGYSNWNVNLAYQPTPGVFPVCDSIAAVVDRHFIRRRHPDGTYVYDGVQFDLATTGATFASKDTTAPQSSDAINWKRAGYTTPQAFDTSWVQAVQYLSLLLRAKAIAAGRQYFIMGGNGASGIAYTSFNGWMRESWPNQQGASWQTNMHWNTQGATRSIALGKGGGQTADEKRFQYDPQLDWIFAFACSPYDSCPSFDPYSTDNKKTVRYGLGTACLTGATFAWGPSFASLAKGGGYESWWYDEYAVDTTTGRAASTANPNWLGEPLNDWHNTVPTINATDLLSSTGLESFTGWTFNLSSPATGLLARSTAAGRASTYGILDSVATAGTASWAAAAVSPNFAVTNGDTLTVTYWAKSEQSRPLEVRIQNGGAVEVVSWGGTNINRATSPVWLPYRFTAVATSTSTAYLAFWTGDTAGAVRIDDIVVQKGRPRGGLYVREFEHGLVVVNPLGRQDSLQVERKYKYITTQLDQSSTVNTGAQIAIGDYVPVPASDAVFLVNSRGTIPPAAARRRGWLNVLIKILGKH